MGSRVGAEYSPRVSLGERSADRGRLSLLVGSVEESLTDGGEVLSSRVADTLSREVLACSSLTCFLSAVNSSSWAVMMASCSATSLQLVRQLFLALSFSVSSCCLSSAAPSWCAAVSSSLEASASWSSDIVSAFSRSLATADAITCSASASCWRRPSTSSVSSATRVRCGGVSRYAA